jgi:hypothetical protein
MQGQAGGRARASGVSTNLSVIALHALQRFAPGSASLAASPPFLLRGDQTPLASPPLASPILEIRILRIRFLRFR